MSQLDKNSSLSIVIPAKNEAENLKLLLPDLVSQDYPEFEIVLVDDASTKDFLKAPLEKYLKDVKLDHIVKVRIFVPLSAFFLNYRQTIVFIFH